MGKAYSEDPRKQVYDVRPRNRHDDEDDPPEGAGAAQQAAQSQRAFGPQTFHRGPAL